MRAEADETEEGVLSGQRICLCIPWLSECMLGGEGDCQTFLMAVKPLLWCVS